MWKEGDHGGEEGDSKAEVGSDLELEEGEAETGKDPHGTGR